MHIGALDQRVCPTGDHYMVVALENSTVLSVDYLSLEPAHTFLRILHNQRTVRFPPRRRTMRPTWQARLVLDIYATALRT